MFSKNSLFCSRDLISVLMKAYWQYLPGKLHKKMASMSNTKDISVLLRKKGLAPTYTGSNEAQYTRDTESPNVWGKEHRLQKNPYFFHISLSNVMFHILSLAYYYHMSLTSTATASNPFPAYSPTMHSMLVCKHPNVETFRIKVSSSESILAIRSLNRSIQSTRKKCFQEGKTNA